MAGNRWQQWPGLVVLLLLVVAVWVVGSSLFAPRVRIISNGIPHRGNFQLACEHWSEPSLRALLEQERLWNLSAPDPFQPVLSPPA